MMRLRTRKSYDEIRQKYILIYVKYCKKRLSSWFWNVLNNLFTGINVPRSRFLPVKKTSDLLLLMSNLYEIDSGKLTLSHLRSFPTTPLVKLGSSFDKVMLSFINTIKFLNNADFHYQVESYLYWHRGQMLRSTQYKINTKRVQN